MMMIVWYGAMSWCAILIRSEANPPRGVDKVGVDQRREA
jgi:hypothetical protein